ncbi:MAG: type IV pilus modification protein PilV [Gammaproteobacteria bacterium]|nr:type IV pilus modification protein PilV [Gammaproteobacteria bacterium]
MSLLEVLIALFVFSVGMLGIAALSLASFQATSNSLWSARATLLVDDMADRIRANPVGRNSYATADAASGTNQGCQQTGGGIPVACTPLQMADDDLFRWNQALNDPTTGLPDANGAALPDVVGSITVDPATRPETVTITVTWNDRSGSASHSISLQ